MSTAVPGYLIRQKDGKGGTMTFVTEEEKKRCLEYPVLEFRLLPAEKTVLKEDNMHMWDGKSWVPAARTGDFWGTGFGCRQEVHVDMTSLFGYPAFTLGIRSLTYSVELPGLRYIDTSLHPNRIAEEAMMNLDLDVGAGNGESVLPWRKDDPYVQAGFVRDAVTKESVNPEKLLKLIDEIWKQNENLRHDLKEITVDDINEFSGLGDRDERLKALIRKNS